LILFAGAVPGGLLSLLSLLGNPNFMRMIMIIAFVVLLSSAGC
jgi:hypothetical protein